MTGAILGNLSAVGEGVGLVRGTISGNGSTSAAGEPRIDLAPPYSPASGNLPPSGPGARSAFYLCLHDSQTGLYDVLLQDDFVDIVPLPNVSSRIRWTPAYALAPVTTTTGDGLVIVSTTPNSKPLNLVVVISGGGATVGSWANTTGVLTLTCGSTCTIATAVAYINSHNTTTTVTTWRAYGVGTLTDVMTGSAAAAGLFLGQGANGIGVSNASVSIQSTTAGSGITWVAMSPGAAGAGIELIFSGTGGLSVAIVGNVITVTLATSGSGNTNALVAAAVIAAQVSAGNYLVAPVLYGTVTDQILATQGTTSGGGVPAATLVGPIDPQAVLHNGLNRPVQQLQTLVTANLTYFHFKMLYTEGGVAVDQLGYGQLYIPSSTAGSGLVITSGTSAPVAASANIASTTAGSGVTVTAVALGAAGNQVGVVFNGPYAGYFYPSTTSGSGVQFTAYGVGALYTSVSILVTSPNNGLAAASPSVNVSGNAITIIPGVTSGIASTNAQIVTAVTASAAASLLVVAASVGTASDPASAAGNATPQLLSGGNGNASSAVTFSVAPNGQWSAENGPGQTISVQFGAGTTNAQLITAWNLVTAVTNIATIAEIAGGVTTDAIVTSPLTYLANGSSPVNTTVQVGAPLQTTTTAAFTLPTSSTIATITVKSTAGFLNPGLATGAFSFVDPLGVTRNLTSTGSSATTFTTSTPGSYPGTAQTIPIGTVIYADAPSAAITSPNLLISLGNKNANNTLTKIVDVVNEANTTATPLVLAAALGTASSTTTSGLIVPQTRLVLTDLMEFLLITKDQNYSLP